jgi:hypothetical protein
MISLLIPQFDLHAVIQVLALKFHDNWPEALA